MRCTNETDVLDGLYVGNGNVVTELLQTNMMAL